MRRKGWSIEDALDHFTTATHSTVRSLHKIPLVWEEMVSDSHDSLESDQLILFNLIAQILDHDLPSLSNDTIVTVWQNTSNAKSVAQRGYRIVHASSEYFYLDCGLGGWIGVDGGGNSWCDPYKTWSRFRS